jgi:hypothetical protein
MFVSPYVPFLCLNDTVSTVEIVLNQIKCVMTASWLRQLFAGLSPRRPGFDTGSVYVGFVVDKVTLGQVFPSSTSVLPCQFHSTCAPLQGKAKNEN